MKGFYNLRLKETQKGQFQNNEDKNDQIKKLKSVKIWFGNPNVELINGTLIFGDQESYIILVANIPENYESTEFCEMIQHYNNQIEQSYIFKTEITQCYGQLIIFKDIKFAIEFFQNFNETHFNQLEEHVCFLKYVQKIKINLEQENKVWQLQQKNSNFKSLFGLKLIENQNHCSICLEQQNFFNLYILCGHAFHWKCLEQCLNNQCPLCRFQMTPQVTQYCDLCQNYDNLWICLICGNIACNMLENGSTHNEAHYLEVNSFNEVQSYLCYGNKYLICLQLC